MKSLHSIIPQRGPGIFTGMCKLFRCTVNMWRLCKIKIKSYVFWPWTFMRPWRVSAPSMTKGVVLFGGEWRGLQHFVIMWKWVGGPRNSWCPDVEVVFTQAGSECGSNPLRVGVCCNKSASGDSFWMCDLHPCHCSILMFKSELCWD